MINFVIKGRLGNAIFRYFACVIMCIKSKARYSIKNNQTVNCNDRDFFNIMNNDSINIVSCNMTGFYQHDEIYKKNIIEIKNFINNHPDHYVLTDGINAGDGKNEKFMMIDILNTPINFTKYYENVLHIRLEDFVTHNLFIPVSRIIDLLSRTEFENLCIVCKSPNAQFEHEYINTIKEFMKTKNVKIVMESNDILTDFHIMKNARTIICSKSTLSWCATLLSDTIETCYFPDYNEQPMLMTCKKPIDNTLLY